MAAPLRDTFGDPTPLGDGLRIAALVMAVASGLALPYLTPLALVSPMMCGGGCTRAEHWLMALLFASPLLLLTSAISGIVAFRSPSWPAVMLTMVPATLVAIVFAILL